MSPRMSNIARDKFSGDLCTHHNGRPIIWNGHLCEGASLAMDREFCLWTRCGSHDVPANAAHVGSQSEVTCTRCKSITD